MSDERLYRTSLKKIRAEMDRVLENMASGLLVKESVEDTGAGYLRQLGILAGLRASEYMLQETYKNIYEIKDIKTKEGEDDGGSGSRVGY